MVRSKTIFLLLLSLLISLHTITETNKKNIAKYFSVNLYLPVYSQFQQVREIVAKESNAFEIYLTCFHSHVDKISF